MKKKKWKKKWSKKDTKENNLVFTGNKVISSQKKEFEIFPRLSAIDIIRRDILPLIVSKEQKINYTHLNFYINDY